MSRTVTRLFDSHTQAIDAVDQLEQAGVDRDNISLLANNADNWHEGHQHPGAGDDNDAADGAGKGATTGGLIGGAGGLLAGLGMLAVPGLGPVVAAGWLASTAVGVIAGAAVGGATGGILGALKDAGHSDEEAQVYAEGVRRGGTLVSVKAHDDRATEIEQILAGRAGVDAFSRGASYREMGWTGFDVDAPAYSADDVARERVRYATGESRSFAGDETSPRDPGDETVRTPGALGAPPLGRDL
jgi:hypothetical protein